MSFSQRPLLSKQAVKLKSQFKDHNFILRPFAVLFSSLLAVCAVAQRRKVEARERGLSKSDISPLQALLDPDITKAASIHSSL